jgi:hypothetical protein
VISELGDDGNLPPGVHWASWVEIMERFGTTSWRKDLLRGLRLALEELRRAGCKIAYVDGSLVTGKEIPGDFDACWEIAGVDPTILDPNLLTFDPGRVTQKAKYFGELFPSSAPANSRGDTFFDFFQIDKDTGTRKGIIGIRLGEL